VASPLDPKHVNLLTIQPEELFDTLVFNPERVYSNLTASTTTSTVLRIDIERGRVRASNKDTSEDCSIGEVRRKATQERSQLPVITYRGPSHISSGNERELERDNMSRVSHLKEIGTLIVSKKKIRSSKNSTAKSEMKVKENSTRKRAVGQDVDSNERFFKVPKIEAKANIGKKVGNSGALIQTIDTPHEVVEVSDTEEECDEKPADHTEDLVMLQHRMKAWQPRNKVLAQPVSRGNIEHASTSGFPTADFPDRKPDLVSNSDDIVKANGGMDVELQIVRRELQVAKEITKRLRQEMEKRDADTLLEEHKQETKAKREIAILVETARQEACVVAELREQFRGSQAALSQQTNEHQTLQALYDQEKEDRSVEQQSHEHALNDILKFKAQQKEYQEQNQTLQNDKSRLVAEVEYLKAAQSARSLSTSSPVPSLSSFTNDEKREDNVRKMYIKTKRQYDILHSVANDLATCTRSMDLSSFGEFGKYLRKLRASLDVEDGACNRQAHGLRRLDDNDE
jgi:hypothetical protein